MIIRGLFFLELVGLECRFVYFIDEFGSRRGHRKRIDKEMEKKNRKVNN